MSAEKTSKQGDEEGSGWGAWSSWAAATVKNTTETFSQQANALADKSINVLAEASEYMQRDLEEFTKVVTEDATTVYSKVAEVTYQSINDYAGEEIAQDALNIKSQAVSILGGGLRSIVSGVEQILLESDEDDEEEMSLTKEEQNQKLQSSDDTYLTNPVRSEFEDWLKDFLDKIETKKEEMTEILIDAPLVRRKYNELVPKDVSHNIFWARYLFRRKIIDEKHARTEEITKRKTSQEHSELDKLQHQTKKPELVKADDEQDVRVSEEVVSLVKSETIKPEDEPEVKEEIKKEVVQQLKLTTAQEDRDKKISSDEDIIKIDSVTNIKLEDKLENTTNEKSEATESGAVEKKSEHSDIDDWEDDLDIDDVDITDVNLDDDDWQMSDTE